MNNGMSEAGSYIGPHSRFQRDQGFDIRPVSHWDFTEPQLPFS